MVAHPGRAGARWIEPMKAGQLFHFETFQGHICNLVLWECVRLRTAVMKIWRTGFSGS